MSIHPDSSFPLLAGDQADVIRIFLDLMSKGDRSRAPSEVTSHQSVGARKDPNDSSFPGRTA